MVQVYVSEANISGHVNCHLHNDQVKIDVQECIKNCPNFIDIHAVKRCVPARTDYTVICRE